MGLLGIDWVLGVCFGVLCGVLIVVVIFFFFDFFIGVSKSEDWSKL